MAQVSVSKTGWWIPEENLEKAAKFLGIKFPITYKLFAAQYRGGTHYFKFYADGSSHHHIILNSRHTIQYANESVWHELIHCVQLEKFVAAGKKPSDFDRAYDSYGRTGKAYWNNPFEIEAREKAAEYCGKMILEMW